MLPVALPWETALCYVSRGGRRGSASGTAGPKSSQPEMLRRCGVQNNDDKKEQRDQSTPVVVAVVVVDVVPVVFFCFVLFCFCFCFVLELGRCRKVAFIACLWLSVEKSIDCWSLHRFAPPLPPCHLPIRWEIHEEFAATPAAFPLITALLPAHWNASNENTNHSFEPMLLKFEWIPLKYW